MSRRLKLVIVLLVLGGSISGYWMASGYFGVPEKMNILILGTDNRRGEQIGRTDVILVVHLDRSQSKAVLLSLPRDTRVDLPKYGWHKINDASVLGGIPLIKRTVQELLGIPVHHYILCDFKGFQQMIDSIGGITIDVEKDMVHDDMPELAIRLKKGRQHLTGQQTLGYVRYRGDALADIGRVERQQKFLFALLDEIKRPANIVDLPSAASKLLAHTETDIPPNRLAQLLALAITANKEQIQKETLPGTPAMIRGVSFWVVDNARTNSMVAKKLR